MASGVFAQVIGNGANPSGVIGNGANPGGVVGNGANPNGVAGNGSQSFIFGPIFQWTDKSGNFNSVQQVTSANQPVLTANEINGRPALVFNGSDSLSNTTATAIPQGTAASSIFGVFTSTNKTNFPFLTSWGASGTDFSLLFNDAASGGLGVRAGAVANSFRFGNQPRWMRTPSRASRARSSTNGVTSGSLGQPAVAVYTAWFTNSTASAVYCALYGTAPTLGTTNPIGGQIEVGAGTTQPVYFGPTNGINKGYFANGIWAGCTTAYLGSTGVAQSVVGVAVTFL